MRGLDLRDAGASSGTRETKFLKWHFCVWDLIKQMLLKSLAEFHFEKVTLNLKLRVFFRSSLMEFRIERLWSC